MRCQNCEKELKDGAKFCDGCGSPIITEQRFTTPPRQDLAQNRNQNTSQNYTQENKTIFILAYLGILFFLPLVACPNSKEGRFHANQGLLLLIAGVAGQILLTVFNSILFWRIWALMSLLYTAWSLAILALAIIGMMNANKNELIPLPIIGHITLIK